MNTHEQKLDSYLREHTSDIHERTEKALEPLQLFTNLTVRNYATFVQIQYQWHLALEEILASANPSLVFDGYVYTPKAPLLRKDLDALDMKPKEPAFTNIRQPAISGIIYVLEGSMLGGTVISKQLEAGGIPAEYRHYFSYCAAAAKKVWPLTRKYLQHIENKDHRFDVCLKTSMFCFEEMIGIIKAEIKRNSE